MGVLIFILCVLIFLILVVFVNIMETIRYDDDLDIVETHDE